MFGNIPLLPDESLDQLRCHQDLVCVYRCTDIQLPSFQLEVEQVPIFYSASRHKLNLPMLPANRYVTRHRISETDLGRG